MSKTIVITGATGNVGKLLAENLLGRGVKVRVVGRDAHRLADLVAHGAEAHVGDLADVSFLKGVLAGADAAYLMIPPNYTVEDFRSYQHGVAAAFREALAATGVPRAVSLSSVGAHLSSGNGPIAGLHRLEQELDAVPGLHRVHLRPAYFFENHLFSVDLIKHAGINGSTAHGDVAIPMVATRDIGDVAAEFLAASDFTGHSVRYILGPEDLTMAAATTILGTAIGRPDLAYVQFPEDEARKSMAGMMSTALMEDYLEMNRGLGAGTVAATEPRSAANSSPTSLATWAQEVFAPAFGG